MIKKAINDTKSENCVVELEEEAAAHGLKRLRKIPVGPNASSYVDGGFLFIAEKHEKEEERMRALHHERKSKMETAPPSMPPTSPPTEPPTETAAHIEKEAAKARENLQKKEE